MTKTMNKNVEKELIMGDYIDWLYKFIKINNSFRNNEARNFYEEDSKNIENIYLFYEGICDYAEKNNIMPNEFGNVLYYVIKYQDLYFSVVQVNYGTFQVYGCGIEYEFDSYIEFEDIRNSFIKGHQKIKTIASEQ